MQAILTSVGLKGRQSGLGQDQSLVLSAVVIAVGISVFMGGLTLVARLEGRGVWLGALLAGTALLVLVYALFVLVRLRERDAWNGAWKRLSELRDVAYADVKLATLLGEPSDPHGTRVVHPDDLALSPQETVWLGSLLAAYEQLFLASLALGPEWQRACRSYLRTQLNKPRVRAVLVREMTTAPEEPSEFWRFVRGVPCQRAIMGYRDFAIDPKFFSLGEGRAPNLPVGKKVEVKRLERIHASFWLELYKDATVQAQMYAAPTSSEEALLDYLSARAVYTVLIDDNPIGGFSLTKEKGRIGTFGIVLHPDFRGKGYSNLIIAEMERKAEEHGFLTLRGDVYSDNAACLRALEKHGFRRFIWVEKNIKPGDEKAEPEPIL